MGSRKKQCCAEGQMIFDFALRRTMLRKLQTGNSHVKHLLRVLDDHAGDSSDCWLKVPTIASEMCLSVRSTERTIKRAIDIDLVVSLPKGRYWKCTGCRAWTPKDRVDCSLCRRPFQTNARWTYRACTTYRLRRAEMFERCELRSDDPAKLAD